MKDTMSECVSECATVRILFKKGCPWDAVQQEFEVESLSIKTSSLASHGSFFPRDRERGVGNIDGA